MNINNDSISLAHVHAYVDAQLTDEDCVRLEDYFDSNPDKFEQLQQYLAINDHYQALYDPVINEDIPQVILDRIYGTDSDPFEPEGFRFNEVTGYLPTILSAKPATWLEGVVRKLYLLVRIDRLSFDAKIPHLQSAPAWMARLGNHVSTLFTNIVASLREVSLLATVIITVLGMLIGMSLGGETQPTAESVAGQGNVDLQAVQAHVFYNGEGRLVLETETEKQQQLLTQLSDRAGKEIHLVDFSELGYRNVGMTLVPSVDGFSLITVYENEQRQSVTLSIGLGEATEAGEVHCAAPGDAADKHNSICGWTNGKLRFVLVSDLVLTKTQQLAEWMKQNYSMAHLISSNEYFFSQTLGTTKA